MEFNAALRFLGIAIGIAISEVFRSNGQRLTSAIWILTGSLIALILVGFLAERMEIIRKADVGAFRERYEFRRRRR